jgi:hypothetical protein
VKRSTSRSTKPATPKANRSRTRPSLRYALSDDGALITYPDGREVCTNTPQGWALYKQRTLEMARRQGWLCCICTSWVHPMNCRSVTFEHSAGRGMDAAHRDDRIVDEKGQPMNGAAHKICNGEKGSRRA